MSLTKLSLPNGRPAYVQRRNALVASVSSTASSLAQSSPRHCSRHQSMSRTPLSSSPDRCAAALDQTVVPCITHDSGPHRVPIHIGQRRPKAILSQNAREKAVLPQVARPPRVRVVVLRVSPVHAPQQNRQRVF